MAQTENSIGVKRIGAVFVTVNDQDKALEFYRDTLDFEVRADVPYGEGSRWIEVGPPGGDSTLALNAPREGGDEKPGGMYCAFLTTDIDANHADLKERGVDVDPEVMRMGDPAPAMFFWRDPDGNSFLSVEYSND